MRVASLSLQHIRKVRPESPEHYCAEDKDAAGDGPEVGGKRIMPLPEPDMIDEALPVPLNYVVNRIELDHVEILDRQDLGRPEYRGHPEEKLDDHADDLPHILKKNYDR